MPSIVPLWNGWDTSTVPRDRNDATDNEPLGPSAYDTDAAWRAEAEELSGLVDVLHPERDAAIIVVNSKTRVDAGFLARTHPLGSW